MMSAAFSAIIIVGACFNAQHLSLSEKYEGNKSPPLSKVNLLPSSTSASTAVSLNYFTMLILRTPIAKTTHCIRTN